jgi:hypothetical protein
MPALITCPQCGLQGDLPDDRVGTLIGCPQCRAEFTARPAAPTGADGVRDDLAVWVGKGPSPAVTPPPGRPLPPGLVGGQGLPPEVTPENAPSHLAWVRAEVGRFQAFVADQLDQLRRRAEELARAESEVAAACVLREQELNRERAALDARAAALDLRTDDLTRAEEALHRRLTEVGELEEALRAELEAQEAEVARQRRAVAEAARLARGRPAAAGAAAAPDLLASWLT